MRGAAVHPCLQGEIEMQFADALRRVGLVARDIIAVGLFIAVMYVLLAAPGLLTDDASTVPLSQTPQGTSR
jgi:hypothetical protein